MQNQENYKNYAVHDFICDEFFQDWVLHPDDQNVAFWRSWIEANPGKSVAIDDAVMLLRNLNFRVDYPEAGRAGKSLEATWKMIQMQEAHTPAVLGLLRWLKHRWQGAAIWMVLIGAAVIMIPLFKPRIKPVQVATEFGQLDTVYLPDRSMVVLNANSTICYNKNWDKNKPREVWLKGEGLFHVAHLNKDNIITPNERFLVHAGPATVEVLGTSFDVRQRRGKLEVALLDGSVRLHFNNQQQADILLKPGDVVSVDTLLTGIKKFRANTGNYTVWTKKQLMLNNPTLQEIVNYLEDIYGKKIVLDDPALASRKVKGPIMLDSLDDALFIISTVLNVKIIRENGILIIKSS